MTIKNKIVYPFLPWRTFKSLTLSVMFFGIPSYGFSTPLVLNGSFEDTNFSTPPYYRYVPSETTLPNWTLSSTGIGEQSYLYDVSPGSNYPQSFVNDGSHALRLSFGDSITQSITGLDIGQIYNLVFNFDVDSFGDPLAALQVSIGSNTQSFSTGGANIVLPFFANNSTLNLSFLATYPGHDNGVSGVRIDGVIISTIPEPSSAILMLFGATFYSLRRKVNLTQ